MRSDIRAGTRSGMFKTIFEPFRIHSVEPLRLTTPERRREVIRDAGTAGVGSEAHLLP